jgi:hypothetical protein
VTAVAAGASHGLALDTDARLWAWGENSHGQLGDGTTTERQTPVQILTEVTAVAAGASHGLALDTDARLWAWGENTHGQLGDGTTKDSHTPLQVLTDVTVIAAGATHSLALQRDGSLWAWGENTHGQLGDGTATERSTPILVLTDVTTVAAGARHSLARKTDGSLWAWGENAYGQLGDGTLTDRPAPVPVEFQHRDNQATTVVRHAALTPASRVVHPASSTSSTLLSETNHASFSASTTVNGCSGSTDAAGTIAAECTANATVGNDCQAAPLTIDTATFAAGTHTRVSQTSIATSGTVTIQTGANVTFRAPLHRYGSGLRVASGAVLSAQAGAVTCPPPILWVAKIGPGTVISTPAGIDCGAICSAPFPAGTSVVLTATAGTDYQFASWTGCDSSSGTSCTLAMSAAKIVKATYAKIIAINPLNDTGTDWCQSGDLRIADCPVAGYPNQDAEGGRDYTSRDDSDGHAGFSFTKLDGDGNPLSTSANDWSCVRDNVTGLTWEIKTNDLGLRGMDWTYSWYNPDATSNGGWEGYQRGGWCNSSSPCDTDGFVRAVNAQGLCGARDWRLPTEMELLSIVNNTTVDYSWFPNTPSGSSDKFWSTSPDASDSNDAWLVSFVSGSIDINTKKYAYHVRLVRGGR